MADQVSDLTLPDLVAGRTQHKNEFDDAAGSVMQDQAVAIRNNVYNAVPQNPATVAQHSQLATSLGVPLEAVQSDPNTAKQQVAMQSFDAGKVVSQYPHLAQFLADPTNAAKAHNDLPTLAATEQAVKALPQPAPASAPPNLDSDKPGLLADAWTGLKASGYKVFGAWDKAAVALSDLLPDGALGKMSPEDRAAYAARGENMQATGIAQSPQRWSGQVAGALGYLPFLEAAPFVMAGTEGTSASQDLQQRGVDPATANKAGAVQGAVLGAANMIPMGDLAFKSGVVPFVKSLFGATAKAGVSGAAQEVAGDTAASQILKANGYGQLADQYGPTIEKAWDSALFMAAMHTGMQTVTHGAPSLFANGKPTVPEGIVTDTARAADATQSAAGLQALGELAAKSELRKNDPQAFHDFVQKVTEDGHLPEVWVDGKTLVDSLNQSGVTPDELNAKLPGIKDQLTEAIQTNGDVRIPTADYATSIAGTPMEAAILPHLKTDPNGMTFAEGQEHLAQQQAEMTAQALDAVKKQAALDERQLQLKGITDDVHRQLMATGRFPVDVAKQYAALHGAFYDTMAERMGISPQEMRERMPLAIKAEGQGGLAQHGVDEATGLPLNADGTVTVYHHTSAERAAEIGRTGVLKSAGEPDLYFTTTPETSTGYGDTAVPFKVKPSRLQLDDEFPDGRQDYRVAAPGQSRRVRVMPDGSNVLLQSASNGPFGPITKDFHHDAQGAVDHLKKTQTGEALGALHHAEIGDIDLPWGVAGENEHDGYGLAKLVAWHPEVVDKLQDVIASMKVTERSDNRAQLESADHKGAVRLQWDGQAKKWLLTAFEKDKGNDAEPSTDTSNAAGPDGSPARVPESIVDETLNKFYQADGNRGFYNPATGELGMLKNADLSTFLHESGHFFLEAMHDLAKSPEAPEGIKSDFDTLLQHFKVEGASPEERMADWSARDLEAKRAGHEQFAEGFENYLMTGKAPVPELQSMFSRFRSWLMSVYHTMRGDVSPEVRAVMDRMFASQETINDAERVRAYAVPDLAAEHGEMIDQYKTLGKEATEQAIADMQARSIRDMKWMSNAKEGKMRELQRSAREERTKITDEVTKEVQAEPINQARTWLTKGEMVDTEGNPVKAEKGYKLNTDTLREMFPKGELGAPDVVAELKGLTSKDGLHPDLVAEMFGFNSGKELVGKLTSGEKPAEKIAALVDQRMLERHGDLVDPVSIQRAAEAAIHNEVRAKFMATGLKMLTKSPMSVAEINKAAKAAADTAIAAKVVGDLRPAQYSAAEAKANKELLKLAPKDPAGAAQAQRAALLNNRLFKSASEAVTDVQKGRVYLKRLQKPAVRARIDVDIRDQIDDLMSRFGLRTSPSDAPTRAKQNLAQWVESQVANGMVPSVTPEMLLPEFRKPYRELTVEEFRGLVDTVRSMEAVGKNRNTILVNGERAELRQHVDSVLIPKLEEVGTRFSAEKLVLSHEDQGLSAFGKAMDHMGSFSRAVNSELKPTDFRSNILDRHEVLGPIYTAIIEPVLNGSYDKVRMLKGLSDAFGAKAEELGKDWQKSLHDFVQNDTLLDPQLTKAAGENVPMKLTRGKMLMMALHSGNESNFDKLTKGYGWNPADVWKMLDQNMGEKDIAAVNHIWELNDKHWPEVEALYREMGQTAPPKIEARPTKLANGELTGGYARISYDPKRSNRGARVEADTAKEIAANGVSVGDYFKRTGTANGAMNVRMEGYTDAINLDFHTIAQAMQETLHDLAYRRALVDANKIVTDPAFKAAFQTAYGSEEWKAINTWLGRVANANNADANADALSKVLQYSRTGMVINGIGFNLSTVIKHDGAAALKSLGFMAGGGERFFASRMASMFHDYTNQVEGAKAKFDEIFARSQQMDRDYQVTSHSLFEPDSWHDKLDRAGHAMIANLDLFSAVPTAWASYDRAVTEGIPVNQGGTGQPMSEVDAVRYANKMVREAHGSNVESARSNFLNDPNKWMKQFGTLYGFMNNTYGQLANISSRLMTPGLSKPATFAQAIAAILVPAIMAEAVSSHFHKKDDESWGGWMAKAIAGEVAGCVPFVRDAASMIQGYKSAGQVPVESWLHTMVQAGGDIYKGATGQGDKGKPIQDVANAVGEAAHLPLGQVGKTAQYLADRASGKVAPPSNALHEVTDPLLGAPHK